MSALAQGLNRTFVIALLLASVALSAPARAQVQTGRIVGTVYDPNRAAVPNATVTVTESATNQSVNVAINEHGDYVVTPLNPGVYRVTVASPGFTTTAINAVEVQVGQSARVDIELKVGETSSTIEVTSTAPLLDTKSGTLGYVVTNTQILNRQPIAVPRRMLQSYQHAELQRPEYEHRYGGRRACHQHAQPAAADPVRVEI